MKKPPLLIAALLLLSGCDNKDDAFYPQMKNFAYLYQFEALPGKVKSTHQTLLDQAGDRLFDITVDFDAQGCPTRVKSIRKEGTVIDVKRAGDRLIGSENGQDVVVTLDNNCAMVAKETANMRVDITYNAQGLVEEIASPNYQAKFHLDYNEAGDMTVLRITEAGAEVSRASAERSADASKISDVVTKVVENNHSRTISNLCKYKNGAPYYCDIITRDGAGDIQSQQHSTITARYY